METGSPQSILNGVVLEGASASGKTISGQRLGAVQIRSRHYVEGGVHKWEAPADITIKDCEVRSIHIWGMAENGEGTVWDDLANPYKTSSRLEGHVRRARANAPSNITLENLTLTGGWRLYVGPGVTGTKLLQSRLIGATKRGAIYLGAESGNTTIKDCSFNLKTDPKLIERFTNRFGWMPGIQVISIDGSDHNTIADNRLVCDFEAIHLYRNCGEGGVVRHTTPSYNMIKNNIIEGKRAFIYVGSRNGKGWFPVFNIFGFNPPCNCDRGVQFGSSKSNKDQARFNTIEGNWFSGADMIRSRDWTDNHSNRIYQ